MSAEKPQHRLRLLAQTVDASTAGLIGITCVYPLNFVKYLIQNQPVLPGKEPYYKNVFDCAKKIIMQQGLRGMYNGLKINALFIIPEKTIKLLANDYLREFLTQENKGLTLSRQILAGAGAGTCQIIVTAPMELLVIRKVTGSNQGEINVNVTSNREHFMKIYHERGLFGLYRGSSATWSRDVFFSVIYFPLFAHLNSLGKGPDETVSFYHTLFSGMAAGSIGAYMATPLDVIKTRIQAKKDKAVYSGVIDCATKIYSTEPLSVFMKGSLLRVLVIAPLFGILQMVYFAGIGKSIVNGVYKSS